jgi:hypothetical protein
MPSKTDTAGAALPGVFARSGHIVQSCPIFGFFFHNLDQSCKPLRRHALIMLEIMHVCAYKKVC